MSGEHATPGPATIVMGDVRSEGLHDVPTAAGLVEAVREFLERDVMAATSGRVQFHTRVAINVLGMVERELRLAAGQLPAHAGDLNALGFATEEALAAAIRTGDLDGRYGEVADVVRRTVRRKLEVANPKYLF